jgi:hypothetical protein
MGRSMGPRTRRGKAQSSKNAAKHWIESGRILPSEQKTAASLRHGFVEDFKPTGLAENEMVDDLVFNRLIKRRIDVAYTREFSKARVVNEIKSLDNQERRSTQFLLRSVLGGIIYRAGECGDRADPDTCIFGLEALKELIEDCGPQPRNLKAVRKLYGDQPTEEAARLIYLLASSTTKKNASDQAASGEAASGDAASGEAETGNQSDNTKLIIESIKQEIGRQRVRREHEEDIDSIESAWAVQEPPGTTLETLLRYRASNTREFNSLLDSLERIRDLRKI